MAKSELALAIEQVCDEKNIPFDSVIDSIEAALAVAYRKEFGNKMLNCRVEFNPEDGSSRIFDVKTVADDPNEEELQRMKVEAEEKEASKKERVVKEKKEFVEEKEGEEEVHRFNPKTDIGITDAKEIKPDAELGDEIIFELPTPEGYGRVAAQTAKQVIIQKLREAERETLYNQYKDRIGEIVNATVQRVEGPLVYMDLGQATAIMPPAQQIRSERYHIGSRFKVYLLSVEKTNKGPEIIASRTAPEMVKELFSMEVPEIASGSIEIKSVAREAGSRSKIAVTSLVENIDPIGSCVGQRGARVQTVMSELGGEKIDIIEYNTDPVKFIVNALSPAKIISVELEEKEQTAKAFVVEDQLSLAIGKGGQNVRLAAKLSGWKIDVMKADVDTTSEEKSTESADQNTEEESEKTTKKSKKSK
ncbi:MAG TPA: transcription termination factor NusA [Patescibacteria group bacterium]|nr:transcription termination factor NusA [Patescibacteria group bacterium]